MKPMLSATVEEVSSLRYPLLASVKLDGIRALVLPGLGLVSRNLKPIPNRALRAKFSHPQYVGLDGELVYGAHDQEVFRRTASAVMSHDGPEDVSLWAFDHFQENSVLGFESRNKILHRNMFGPEVVHVGQKWVNNSEELLEFEVSALADGYEGVMLRDPNGPYKQGRSTLREGWLMKLKRFADAEAIVIGMEERKHNGNELTRDALGRAERSSHQANLTGRGDLGALVCRGLNGPYAGVQFNIGTGFDDRLRGELWAKPPIGQVVTYKYFPTGSKDAPRFPVFLRFRADANL